MGIQNVIPHVVCSHKWPILLQSNVRNEPVLQLEPHGTVSHSASTCNTSSGSVHSSLITASHKFDSVRSSEFYVIFGAYIEIQWWICCAGGCSTKRPFRMGCHNEPSGFFRGSVRSFVHTVAASRWLSL